MVTIRPMTEEDMDAVRELSMAAYGAAGHFDANDSYAHTVADVRGRREHGELLVADDDGIVVGAVMLCSSDSEYAEMSLDGEMEFRFLAVDPQRWGQQIGEHLVKACEERARGAGIHSMVICVINTNVIAHRFYQRLGYERVPERDWQPRPGVDLLGFQKVLD
jgi:predicted N-acetyltransferase YhbS